MEEEEPRVETIQLDGEPVLEAQVEHINALIELVEAGDDDAAMLILRMYLEHNGDKATFVRHGIALGPYVDMALQAVTDGMDTTAAIDKVVDKVPVPDPVEYEPGEIRVEMATENEHGVKVPNWVVRDDHEIHSWHPDPDSAVAALEKKLSGEDDEIPPEPLPRLTAEEHKHTHEHETEKLLPSEDAESEAETEVPGHSHRQDVD
jgi:hypothetical protein